VKIDDIFKEMEEMQKKMMESFMGEFNDLEERVSRGEMRGNWEFQPIERPGVKGFIIRGSFGTPMPLDRPTLSPEPFNPVKPLNPLIKRPREPLYDLSNTADAVALFVELPGIEEKDILVTPSEGGLELEAGDFNTVIKLPETDLEMDNMTREYHNGVLTLSIPKSNKLERKE
jgi:HSP20 family molecular chaperone IbpA